MKKIIRLLAIALSWVSSARCLPKETGCGFPGIPLNGFLTFTVSGHVAHYNYFQITFDESIRNGFWPVETLVDYECETEGNFVLTGSRRRICLGDGTWGGQLPFCDENVAYGRRVFVSYMAYTTLLTDGIIASETSDGIYFNGEGNDRLVLHLQSVPFESVNIRSVIIYGNGEENWQENCQNSIVLRDTEAETRCSAPANVNNSIQISCPDDGILSRKITFFNSSKAKCFIVEIQVFVRPKNRCGFPEVPTNGFVLLFPYGPNPEAASYRCSSGFRLTGLKERKCIGRSWSGQPSMCHSTFHVPTSTTSPKTSVTNSTLTTPKTTRPSEVSIDSTFRPDEVPHEDNRTETITTVTKSSTGFLGTESITIIVVLATALAISLSIIIFLYKRRSRQVQSNAASTKNSFGYEVPDATLFRLINLDIIPDQELVTEEHIYESVDNITTL